MEGDDESGAQRGSQRGRESSVGRQEAMDEDEEEQSRQAQEGRMSHTLILEREEGGLRHYLDGRDVHAGDVLELQKADGSWVLGRYEWTFREGARPAFYLDDGEPVFLSSADVLRWPDTSRRGAW